MNYSIVTPTRNEGKYIRQTIESVIKQELLPEEWIIMDDESDDDTATIISHYLTDYPFIKYHKLSNFREELRNRGGRVAAIINHADSLRSVRTDLIAKIDGDISFDKDFFANMVHEFTNDKNLAIASGHMVEDGIPETIYDRISGRGASLVIRYDVYLKIGKFYVSKTRGEDDLAYVAARSFGWKTQTFDHYFNHLKPIGIRNSKLKNHYETGFYKGTIPYWIPFFLATVLRDVFKKPYIFGALTILYGYCHSRYFLRYKPFPHFVTIQYRLEQKSKFRKLFATPGSAKKRE